MQFFIIRIVTVVFTCTHVRMFCYVVLCVYVCVVCVFVCVFVYVFVYVCVFVRGVPIWEF